MPLFKGVSSKATPKAAIRYITRDDKAAYVSVRNLFEDEDYAKQFEETASRFKKGKKYDERKYYHFKLSCARKDNVDAQEAHIYAEELAAKLFPDCECVIATHTDIIPFLSTFFIVSCILKREEKNRKRRGKSRFSFMGTSVPGVREGGYQ